jgi:hypothetical protein
VSALGHYLEVEGIATTIVSLVRLHSEIIKPPRSLFVPFELGRPLGPPNNPRLQSHVLESALALLESDDGPSVLVDFDHIGVDGDFDPNWMPPINESLPIELVGIDAVRLMLFAEVASLQAAYTLATAARGRTTVGVVKLSMDEIVNHMVSFLKGPHKKSPRDELSAAMVLRFGADDLKAYYYEAATLNGHPSSWQLGNWFWRHTVAGKILIALRAAALVSDDKRFHTVCGSHVVPRIWILELNL